MKKTGNRKAYLLIEVIVSAIILTMVVVLVSSVFVMIIKGSEDRKYNLVAVNLARAVLEFGEGVEYTYGKEVTTCWPIRIECCGGGGGLHTPCGTCCCSQLCGAAFSYQLVYRYDPELGKYAFNISKDFQWLDKTPDNVCGPEGPSSLSLEEALRLEGGGGGTVVEPTPQKTFEQIINLEYNPFNHMEDIKAKGMVPYPNEDSVRIIYTVTADQDPFDRYFRRHMVEVRWLDSAGKERAVVLGTVPLNRINDTFKLKISQFGWEK
ncbi:MAG: hypothetical protein WC335_04620 [Candidatus Omnitrophota bacterium]